MKFYKVIVRRNAQVVIPKFLDYAMVKIFFPYITYEPIIGGKSFCEGDFVRKTNGINWESRLRPLPKTVEQFLQTVVEARQSEHEFGSVRNYYYKKVYDGGDQKIIITRDASRAYSWKGVEIILYEGEVFEKMLSRNGYVEMSDKVLHIDFHGDYYISAVAPFEEGIFFVIDRDLEKLFSRSVFDVEWFCPLVTFESRVNYTLSRGNSWFVEYVVGDRKARIKMKNLESQLDVIRQLDVFGEFGII